MSDMDHAWELISDDKSMLSTSSVRVKSERLRVPGGWIVRTVAAIACYPGGATIHTAQTFVPEFPER